MQYSTLRIAIEPQSIFDHRIDYYIDYIAHLSTFTIFNEHSVEQDTIRFPLQPLYDNLDNHTYEVFERDPSKYSLYQRAIEAALLDMVTDEDKMTKTTILMIVGCGRGPLIRAALNASANTQRKLKILAVEKNPSAIILLSSLMRDLWADKDITLISKDMRQLELEEKVDILVSELMGSFGDNELSPECLDGVQHLLKPTGVSIPQNSKSYLQPIMHKGIYGQIQRKNDAPGRPRVEYSEGTEINWLSYLMSVFHIDEAKELFTFVHPNKDVPIDNARSGKLTFKSPVNCVLHGFAGYFTSKLYKDIEISILPVTHTKGKI
jgi:protein arginine N-methyltransferase 5